MKISTKRAWALAWGSVSTFVAAVAFLQFASMLIGFYDPTADDRLLREYLPFFRFRLILQIVVFSLSAIFALGYFRRTNGSNHVSESIE